MSGLAPDRSKLIAIAQYMNCGLPSDSAEIRPADGAIVFCREDPRMAMTAAELYQRKLCSWIVLAGGLGKDSGPNSKREGSEAAHQGKILVEEQNVPASVVHLEQASTNGAENTRRSIDLIQAKSLRMERGIILVMPPRSARRLFATHTKIARDELNFSCSWQVVTINDPFDPDDPTHVTEVLQELVRVADGPKKRLSDPQSDLPCDLVSWARKALAREYPCPALD